MDRIRKKTATRLFHPQILFILDACFPLSSPALRGVKHDRAVNPKSKAVLILLHEVDIGGADWRVTNLAGLNRQEWVSGTGYMEEEVNKQEGKFDTAPIHTIRWRFGKTLWRRNFEQNMLGIVGLREEGKHKNHVLGPPEPSQSFPARPERTR